MLLDFSPQRNGKHSVYQKSLFQSTSKNYSKWEDHFVKFSYGFQKPQSLWGALEVLGDESTE
jgi:hypothetical protein